MKVNAKMLEMLSRPLALHPSRMAAVLASLEGETPWDLDLADAGTEVATVIASGPIGPDWLNADHLATLVEAQAAGSKAVVLSLDSPGGMVDGVEDAAARLASLPVPLVVHTPGMLASAAYWLASGADAILAATSAEVGSIGVYCPMVDVRGMYEAFGISVELAKTGELKGMGFPGTAWTDAQKDHMQQIVEDIFGGFTAAVRAGRPAVPEDAMTGGGYMARRAAGLGLVDDVGTLEDARALAGVLARARAARNNQKNQ